MCDSVKAIDVFMPLERAALVKLRVFACCMLMVNNKGPSPCFACDFELVLSLEMYPLFMRLLVAGCFELVEFLCSSCSCVLVLFFFLINVVELLVVASRSTTTAK